MLQQITLVVLISVATCLTGVSIQQGYSDASFSCFASNGASYAAVQAFTAYGSVNSNTVQNLKFAKNRGFNTDIFMNHCVGRDAATQVNQMLNAVPGNLYDTVWISVETNTSPGCGWTQNTPQRNCDYLRAIVGAVNSFGKNVGIFSSIAEWTRIFQSSSFCYQLGNLPVWYGSYDGNKAFSDFRAFGGWLNPTRKTYESQYPLCGTSVNLSWSP